MPWNQSTPRGRRSRFLTAGLTAAVAFVGMAVVVLGTNQSVQLAHLVMSSGSAAEQPPGGNATQFPSFAHLVDQIMPTVVSVEVDVAVGISGSLGRDGQGAKPSDPN